MLPEPIAVTLLVIEALEALAVPYLMPGSLASHPERTAYIASSEDIALAKLELFRFGRLLACATGAVRPDFEIAPAKAG